MDNGQNALVKPTAVWWRRPLTAPAVLLALLALLVITVHTNAYTRVSPIDELQHFDYAVKASRGHVVREGERVGQDAMRAEACHGVDSPGAISPPCDLAKFDPSSFRELGYNTAANQSPVYYAVSGLCGRLLVAVGVTDDLFRATRLAGAGWLGAGLVVSWMLMSCFGIPTRRRWPPLVIVATAPVVLHATATVNADGTLLLTGASMAIVSVRWIQGRLPLVVPIATSFIVMVIEPTNIFVVAVAAALGVCAASAPGDPLSVDEGAAREGREAASRAIFGIAVTVAAILAVLGGFLVRRAIALDIAAVTLPRDSRIAASELRFDNVVGQMSTLATPLWNPYLPAELSTRWTGPLLILTNWFLLAGTIGSAFLGRMRLVALAAGCLIAVMLLGGPALAWWNFQSSRVHFAIPGRYGLSLLPLLAAVVAYAVQRRAALVAAYALAAACFFNVMSTLT